MRAWNKATSCGIAVIAIVRARQTPMEPPIATASKTHRNEENPHGS